jgi:dienelactone hydrolase
VYLALPTERDEPLKSVVVMHGSGGPWDDEDTDGDDIADVCNVGEPSRQTEEWRDLLLSQGVAAVFFDSYSPRNTCENEGDYKNPPLKFLISGTFIRNRDAYAVLELLRSLTWSDTNQPVLDSENIGLVGFSDGGTTGISTLFDTEAVPASWTWKQSFDGTVYTSEVLPPVERPSAGGFKAGVLYYPGSFHNGYYGNLCNGQGIYKSYCDVMIHIAETDPLTENTVCLINTMDSNGGGEATVFEYAGIGHGFDGEDEPASTEARSRTINFLKGKLGF